MKKVIQSIFLVLAWIGIVIFGIWDLRITYAIVNEVAGPIVAYISFLIAPIIFVLAPWYALIAWGDWHPLVIIYGGGVLVTLLFLASGAKID